MAGEGFVFQKRHGRGAVRARVEVGQRARLGGNCGQVGGLGMSVAKECVSVGLASMRR